MIRGSGLWVCILRFNEHSDNEIHIGLSFYLALPLIIAVSEKLRDNFSVVLAALVHVSKANEVNVHTIYLYTIYISIFGCVQT